MKVTNKTNPVQDYWKFTKELRSQMNLVKMLERQFFDLEDLCDYAIKNDITWKNEKGERVCAIGELGCQQGEVFERMRIEVGNLYDMLMQGRQCFNLENE